MFRSFITPSVFALFIVLIAACAPTQGAVPASPTLEVVAVLTQTPSGAAAEPEPITPTSRKLIHYEGPNPYRSTPMFGIDYDPSVWEFIEQDGSGREPRLDHRSIAVCSVWLGAGPVGAEPVSTINLAGHEWTVSRVQPEILMYTTPIDDIAFIFGLFLPEPYATDVTSPCQQALEAVMQTFQVVADTETLPPAASNVLPAPLYYLVPGDDTTQQIWRIETDGSTRTQITQEAAGVSDFDVSARDGSLAYLTGNALITTDGRGHNRSVLVQGPTLAPERGESYYTTEVTRPRWSPDGSRLAYGLSGINLIDATGGASTALLPNDPIPGPNDPMTQTASLYWPHNWSPDGSRMLIEIGYYRSEGSLGVLNLADNSVAALSSPAGYVCCAPAWADNNRTIIYANPVDGIVPPGLWRTDVTTGEGETLINGIAKDAVLSVANVFPTANGELYYFYAVTKAPRDPGQNVRLSMYRSQSDGVTDQTQLRTDAYVIGEALWASDVSGAVIVDAAAGDYPPQGPLLYLKADGSPAIPLAESGRLLHWGK